VHNWQLVSVKMTSAKDVTVPCPQCGKPGNRLPSRFGFTGAGDWNRQEFNHGLGCVATPKQAEKIAKNRGLIPVGSEPAENMHKHFDKVREERREQRYADAANLK
jgi:hypothetical protein